MDNGTVTTLGRRGPWLPLLLLIGWAAVLSYNSARAQQEAKSAVAPAVVKQRQEQFKDRNALWQKSHHLRDEGKLPEAVTAAEGALIVQRELFGGNDPGSADVLTYLAELHLAREDFAAAKKTQEQALAIRAKLNGAADWRAVDAQVALAHIQRLAGLNPPARHELAVADDLLKEAEKLRAEGKFRQAIPPAERCTAIRKRLLGDSDVVYADAMAWSGFLYNAVEDYAQAEPVLRQALSLYKVTRGENHPAYANSLNNLGFSYAERGDFAKAEPLYQRAMEIDKRALGDKNLGYATDVGNLAALYKKTGDYDKAEPLYRQALEIRRQVLGENHPDYAASVDDLVQLLENAAVRAGNREDFAAARRARQEVLELRRKQYGSSDWHTVNARVAVAHLEHIAAVTPEQRRELAEADGLLEQVVKLQAGRKFRESITPAERCVAIRKRLLGDSDTAFANALAWLGYLYKNNTDYGKAEPLLRHAMEIYKQVLGERHPDYATSLDNLAAIYRETGDYAKAEPLLRQALESERQMRGERHPAYLTSLNNLASLYDAMGDHARAELFFRQALETRKQVLGERHPDYATSLNNLGLFYKEKGDVAKAEPLLRQALKINRQALGERHPHYAASLNNLGLLYQAMGDYAKAEPLLHQAMDISKQVQGERHPEYATSLNNLGLLYQAMGDYAKAEPLHRQALEIRKQVQGERHPHYAWSLNNLAALYKEMGDYAKAEPLFCQALEIDKQALGEKHSHYAASLNSLGMLYEEMGDYAKAEPLVRRALQIRKQALGERHPLYAASLNSLGSLYQAMGDYPKAEPLLRQALEIRKQVQGERNPDCAGSLVSLALLYQSMGDYAKAEPLFRQVMQIDKQALGERHPDYATSLHNLATLYKEMGDYAKAEPLYRQALAIYQQAQGERHPHCAQCLNNLAALYDSMEDYAKAEPLFRQALGIWKQSLGERHPVYAQGLNNLALLYKETGDYAKAEPLYRQAMEIWKQVQGERHPDYATSLHNLAALYHETGDYAKAEPLLRQALAIRKELLGERHPDYVISLHSLALLKAATRQPRDAEQLSRQALSITRQHLDLTSAVQSERQQLAMTQETRRFLNSYLSASLAAGTPADQVYTEVLASKGAVWTRQQGMRRMRQDPALAAKPEVAKLYADLEQASRALANLLASRPDPRRLDEHRRKLESTSEEVERLQQALASVSREYRAQRTQQNRTAADIQSALPRGSVLVDFLEYKHYGPPERGAKKWTWQRRLAAFVVRPDHAVGRLDLGLAEPIQETVEKWRAGYSAEEAAKLKQLVWKPLEPLLSDAKTVLISPDGALARFPFSALPGKKPNTYLIEELSIAVVPVPQMLPELLAKGRSPRADAPSLLAVGDVDFDAAPGQPRAETLALSAPRTVRGGKSLYWPALPGTQAEIDAIATSFSGQFPHAPCTLLRKDQATKRGVVAQLGQYPYLHFATHGYFAPAEIRSASDANSRAEGPQAWGQMGGREVVGFHPGLLSGLVLAGANRPVQAGQDDAILTALEVAELDLRQVDLVTLSACETGLGKSTSGEGLLGLQRAFQLAGAGTAVASLWQVPDLATQNLMRRFYENIWGKKMSKLEALRDAQLAMLRNYDPQAGRLRAPDFSHSMALPTGGAAEKPAAARPARLPPAYWAAFVLSGDWR